MLDYYIVYGFFSFFLSFYKFATDMVVSLSGSIALGRSFRFFIK